MYIFLCLGLNAFSQNQYWITFTDKGSNAELRLETPQDFLPTNVLERRALFDIPVTQSDLPISATYLSEIIDLGAEILKTSKWLNGILVQSANPDFGEKLTELKYIKEALLVQTFKNDAIKNKVESVVVNSQCIDGEPIYGCAYDAINMLNGQFLHEKGFYASTIDFGVMDNGFQYVNNNRFFDSLNLENKITGVYNYVDDNAFVFNNGDHGAWVMSTLAANIRDTLVGTAPKGNYHLFTTEDNNNEGLPEEVNWAMAAEWAEENLGNWVVLTTSLGYSNGYSDPSTNHVYADMDGNTTIITKAADLAAQKGLLVVNSAGNEGNGDWKFITAPADGDSVLAVGAVDLDGNATVFSSFGPSADGRIKPNVSALGRRVAAANFDGTLDYINGTSFSCPIIAGLAACLWEAFPNKSNMEIIKAIEQSAHLYYNPNDQLGFGIPNFEKAFEILSITEANEEQGLRIYPNPVNDELNIFFLNQDKHIPYQLVVSDMSGRVWFEKAAKENTAEQALRVSELPSGVYAIFVQQGKDKYRAKFIKR